MVVGAFPLDNKIAVVTGGGSGINLSFAKLLLSSPGTKALICDLKLTSEAEELAQHNPDRLAFMRCDVSNWNDLTSIPSQVSKAFGQGAVADIWIAGAGVFEPRWSSFLYDEEEDGYKVMRINAEHPIKLTRIATRSLLRANKPGVVLLVASVAGLTGEYRAALYCASKHAVVGFTKSMAQADVDENVKVVCICPGVVSTPLWTGDEAKDVAAQFQYKDEAGIGPEEIALAMKEMVEGEEYAGGSLLKVAKGNLREKLDSQRAYDTTKPEMKAWADVCYQPIREVFGRERNGG
ncbi:hypothetical protein B0A54_05979 [Lecanosticta acicola]|uniref:NAD(P)-binding protein n=1 Tax=Lecanosticta acicola TaxID=111012 RepID=A0AAI8YTA8_9PEZI|nr:hypothetical protein B0A54_05979 [Lecanosticta acicola]